EPVDDGRAARAVDALIEAELAALRDRDGQGDGEPGVAHEADVEPRRQRVLELMEREVAVKRQRRIRIGVRVVDALAPDRRRVLLVLVVDGADRVDPIVVIDAAGHDARWIRVRGRTDYQYASERSAQH